LQLTRDEAESMGATEDDISEEEPVLPSTENIL
jgi:hypothetical protein